MHKRAEKVLERIGKGDGPSADRISAETGLSRSNTWRWLGKLEDQGYVFRELRGRRGNETDDRPDAWHIRPEYRAAFGLPPVDVDALNAETRYELDHPGERKRENRLYRRPRGPRYVVCPTCGHKTRRDHLPKPQA